MASSWFFSLRNYKDDARPHKHKFLERSSKNWQISNVTQILPVGAELFRAGGRAGGPAGRRAGGQADRRTDMTKLIVIFRSYENGMNKEKEKCGEAAIL